MKVARTLRKLFVGLAIFGLISPQVRVANGADLATVARQHKIKIVDVTLSEGGVLKGQVITSQGKGIAKSEVTLYQGKTPVARTTTNDRGEFAVSGLKGGVYAIGTDGAAGLVRTWNTQTAPPSAVAGILLVPQKTTLGQNEEEEEGVVYEEEGGNGVGAGTNLGLGALVVGGLIATVIAVSVDHNSAS